ncbi:MAG TPA: hypothetical protein VGI58_03995 [Streptosporangiaceae bacterium]
MDPGGTADELPRDWARTQSSGVFGFGGDVLFDGFGLGLWEEVGELGLELGEGEVGELVGLEEGLSVGLGELLSVGLGVVVSAGLGSVALGEGGSVELVALGLGSVLSLGESDGLATEVVAAVSKSDGMDVQAGAAAMVVALTIAGEVTALALAPLAAWAALRAGAIAADASDWPAKLEMAKAKVSVPRTADVRTSQVLTGANLASVRVVTGTAPGPNVHQTKHGLNGLSHLCQLDVKGSSVRHRRTALVRGPGASLRKLRSPAPFLAPSPQRRREGRESARDRSLLSDV